MTLELFLLWVWTVLVYFTGFIFGYNKRTEQEFTKDWDIDDLTDEEVKKIINFFFEIKKGK
jgi:hypothetical protein